MRKSKFSEHQIIAKAVEAGGTVKGRRDLAMQTNLYREPNHNSIFLRSVTSSFIDESDLPRVVRLMIALIRCSLIRSRLPFSCI
jgi:hypothetical protein